MLATGSTPSCDLSPGLQLHPDGCPPACPFLGSHLISPTSHHALSPVTNRERQPGPSWGLTDPQDTPGTGMGRTGHRGPAQPLQGGWPRHPVTKGCWQLPAVRWLCKRISSLHPKQTSQRPLFFPLVPPAQPGSDSRFCTLGAGSERPPQPKHSLNAQTATAPQAAPPSPARRQLRSSAARAGGGGPAHGRGGCGCPPARGHRFVAAWDSVAPVCYVSLDMALLLQVDDPLASRVLGRRWLSLHP